MNQAVAAHDKQTFSSTARNIVRGLLLLIGVALLVWGLSDDERITGGPGLGLTQIAVLILGLLNIIASALRINFALGLLVAKLEWAEPFIKKVAREAAQILRVSILGDKQPVFDPVANIETGLQQHLDEYQEYVVEGDNVIRMLRNDPCSADISLLPDSPSAQYKLNLMDAVIGASALQLTHMRYRCYCWPFRTQWMCWMATMRVA